MEVRIPELGESITEGTLTKWMVKPGDAVNQGDVLAEVETDKVNMEVVAEGAGTVRELRKQEGDTVQIGEVIAVIAEGEGAAPQAADAGGGEAVEPGESRDTPAAAGSRAAAQAASEAASSARTATTELPPLPATPSARKYAREHGIDLASLPRLKGQSRVGIRELQALAAQPSAANAPHAPGAAGDPNAVPREAVSAAVPSPSVGSNPDKPVERRRMSRRRQTIARRLVQVQQEAAMLTTFNEIDMTAVMDLRRRRKDAFYAKHGVKLGFMSFFTKAAVAALKEFPLLNAEIQGDEILVKKFYDIGIAVSTDEGLVVPVVRDADKLSFAGIEREIASLADRARNGKLRIADLEGGTFTITNGGVFGSLMSTPILNPPQVGILGMHKIQTRPVAMPDGRTENRPMMYVALSYDHRIVDGKEAVGFHVRVKELLEDPEALMFDV
jgi:2-oxoglutarate dehydrogenase E2 component (dihydrolipoamide succinyltransferase)